MNYLSEVQSIFRHSLRLHPARLIVANYSNSSVKEPPKIPKDNEIYDEDAQASVQELLIEEEEDVKARERKIKAMRNKSRLNKTHRNLLFNLPKPDEEYTWDKTLQFSRKQFGKYGSASGIDPRLCFFTPAEVADKTEYERVAYPYTIPDMIEQVKHEKAAKQTEIVVREKKIAENLTKLNKWMDDLNARVAKKEAEVRLAKEKREKLMEDIRQELGFRIDQRDPRFKELIEKKELEAKKEKKADKKKKREELLMQKLKEQAESELQNIKKPTAATTEADDKDGDDVEEEVAEAKQAKASKTEKGKGKSTDKAKDDSDSDGDSDDEKKKKK